MNSVKIYLWTTRGKVSKIDLNARWKLIIDRRRASTRSPQTWSRIPRNGWRVGPATKRRKNRGKRSISQSLARENASTGQSCALERVRDGRGAQVVGLRVHSCRMRMHLRLARFFFTHAVEQTHSGCSKIGGFEQEKIFRVKVNREKKDFFLIPLWDSRF